METQAASNQKPRRKGRPLGSLGRKKRDALRQGREAVNLPAPIERPASPASESLPAPSLLDGVRNLFQPKAAEPLKFPSSADSKDFSMPSAASSASTEGPLSEEAARLLASVPESIGGGAEPGAEEPQEGAAGEVDPIAALMAQVVFKPQEVQDQLSEFFDWLAERTASAHWKLTDRQGRMLAGPLTSVLYAMWQKLQVVLPDVLGRWCEETPGAMALLMASGLVIGPKCAKQFALSKAKRRAVPLVKDRPQVVRPETNKDATVAPLPVGAAFAGCP